MQCRAVVVALVLGSLAAPCANGQVAKPATVTVETPLSPPGWALLERELLKANTAACKEFFGRYFDERGYLLCVERWGGDDGPDDAIENCSDWPLLVALGAPDTALLLYKKAWEGHLRQYTLAKTVQVPFARDGMYYKEFPVMFDWLHHSEGLTPFYQQGLADPSDLKLRQRAQRFAGFYLNEDPDAPNYDPKHKIIRSLFNGSRGPLLRKATALDWAGDPIEVKGRFKLLHGERNYEEMLAHFKDYTDIIGDHPQNLLATTMAVSAYMLTHEAKYKAWALEYVEAWRQRMLQNGGIIPTNIGLDGKIGSAVGGKWYGGVYGWGFTVVVPQNGQLAHRNSHHLGFVGFVNAYLLTGDDRFLDAWRKQFDQVNAHKKVQDGQVLYPHMHGEQGWYHFKPEKYAPFALELYCLSHKSEDRARVPASPWLDYLEGKNAGYPEAALRKDLANIRDKVRLMRRDTTTPDTRLADDPLRFTPVSVAALVELMLGGPHPGKRGSLLHCQVRYFDAEARRPGLPQDVAALVEEVTADGIALTLVNLNQLESRSVLVQAGGYGEHQFTAVATASSGKFLGVDADRVEVRLAAGAGARIVLKMKRHVHQPTLTFPWGR